MAASGVAEHNEAYRREKVVMKRAYLQRLAELEHQKRMTEAGLTDPKHQTRGSPNTYDVQVAATQPSGHHHGYNAATVDRERRKAHHQEMQSDYSAKLPNRYSSTDYVSQW